VPLPTTPVVNELRPERLRAILFSRGGGGKTSLAAGWYPKTNLIIDLEGGTRFLPGEHFIERPATYAAFMQLVHELTTTQHQFTTVTIDTIDKLVRMADAEAGQRHGKVAAGLADYGRGLADRDGTLMRDLGRLLASDLGVILCAHAITVGITQADGTEVERTFPRIESGDGGDRLRQPIIGEFDYLFHVRKHPDEKRDVVTGGHAGVETKRRHAMADVVPLPADPSQGGAALYAAVAESLKAAA
jgi:hypothetical protein